jgi:hypothetical protein
MTIKTMNLWMLESDGDDCDRIFVASEHTTNVEDQDKTIKLWLEKSEYRMRHRFNYIRITGIGTVAIIQP